MSLFHLLGGGEGAVLKISTERTLEEDTEIPFTKPLTPQGY